MEPYFDQLIALFMAGAPRLLTALVIFVLSLYVARLLSKFVERVLQKRRAPAGVVQLLGQLALWSIIVAGTITALQQFFQVTAFLAGLGILGFTIGFALLALGPFVYVGGVNTHIPGPWALLRYVPVVGLARMPSRFAIVATIGIAVLLAGGLAAVGAKWPHRRRQLGAVAGLLLIFELWPAPRTLYSAQISPVFDRIAADTRELRVLSLPFGVRDRPSASSASQCATPPRGVDTGWSGSRSNGSSRDPAASAMR